MQKGQALLIAAFLISFTSFGQVTQYFAMYFQTKVTEKTPYKRIYSKGDNQVSIEDFKYDKLQVSGIVDGTTDLNVVDDLVAFIRSQGLAYKYKETFKQLEGRFTFYHDSGKPSNEVHFKKNKPLFVQVWTEDGEEKLMNGTGVVVTASEDYDEECHEAYKDSLMVGFYAIRRLQKDTVYLKVDRLAEPKEGLQSFYQELVKVLKYPMVARFAGKEGRVFIQFVVDDRGKLTEFSPKTNEGYRFETKVIKKLEAFPDWNPAVYKGRFVKMRFVLPISYKLTN